MTKDGDENEVSEPPKTPAAEEEKPYVYRGDGKKKDEDDKEPDENKENVVDKKTLTSEEKLTL